MAVQYIDNLSYQGKKGNFERDQFATKAAMKAYPEASIDEGHLAFCLEDNKRYEFRASNSVDTITGRWREFKPGMTSVPLATDTTTGGIKAEGKTLAELPNENKWEKAYIGSDGKLYVQVPILSPLEGLEIDPNGDLNLKQAAAGELGGIKTGYTANNKNYPVALDENGKAYVNVPWANTTYNKATSAADGLMSAVDKVKLDGLSIASVAEVEALLA